MTNKRDGIFADANKFFELNGSTVMILTAGAAIDVCRIAANQGRMVGRIEGGIWDKGSFEARLDCIWDAPDALSEDVVSVAQAAQTFICSTLDEHNAYIVSLAR